MTMPYIHWRGTEALHHTHVNPGPGANSSQLDETDEVLSRAAGMPASLDGGPHV